MSNSEKLLTYAEELIYQNTSNYLSDLQRIILASTLQEGKKTYEQIARENSYSAKYVKQDIAPRLWQLFSQILGQKINKSNIKAVLEQQVRHQLPVVPSPKEKGNILIVDDHPENVKLLSYLLEDQGYEVQQAINGVIALEAIAITLPDLILLDINMPDIDGYTVCQKIKQSTLTQDIPVIFVSAFDEAWDKVKGFSVGGSDYISKPFNTIEVIARVENQLKVRRIQQELKEKNRQLQETLNNLEAITK